MSPEPDADEPGIAGLNAAEREALEWYTEDGETRVEHFVLVSAGYPTKRVYLRGPMSKERAVQFAHNTGGVPVHRLVTTVIGGWVTGVREE